MSATVKLPVLPLDDEIVLPGMVVPIDLSESETRAAIEAAQAQRDALTAQPGIRSERDAEVLVTPRHDGSYGAIGVRAVIEQIGRLPNGRQAYVTNLGNNLYAAGTLGDDAAIWGPPRQFGMRVRYDY